MNDNKFKVGDEVMYNSPFGMKLHEVQALMGHIEGYNKGFDAAKESDTL